jgi:hypothetical protein
MKLKTDYSGVKIDYEFLADLQTDLESAAADYGREMRAVVDGDDADTIVKKANGNTKAHERLSAASERLDQALRVVLKQSEK